MSGAPADLARFQAIIGVQFRHIEWLQTALTHSSYVNENAGADALYDNERLEFLGDAALDLIAADLLFRKFPHLDEGDLTQLRSALVKTEALARFADICRLGEFLRVGKGEEQTGARQRSSTLSHAFEAVIGAIYLDQGLSAASDFLKPLLLDLLREVLHKQLHLDARSELQERLATESGELPDYRVTAESGPEHAKQFTIAVFAGGELLGSGSGSSKRRAAQAAADDALQKMRDYAAR